MASTLLMVSIGISSSILCLTCFSCLFLFFFFNDTATTEIYTLSLHDALPISLVARVAPPQILSMMMGLWFITSFTGNRSEEHTSELQSRRDLVCRLLLEKKKNNTVQHIPFKN